MIELSLNETRVIGSLMEKAITTPDQYPMTLNAIIGACNQKSSRNPVLNLDQGTVHRTLNQLEERHLIMREEGFGSRVPKFKQRFCNTPFSDLTFSEPEYAVICLLLLRGSQTPGELKTRCNRLFEFHDNEEVAETLRGLISPESGPPLVAQLPRTTGRRDSEYVHLFSGEIDSDPPEPAPAAVSTAPPAAPARRDRLEQLEARLAVVEKDLAELKELLGNDPTSPAHS